MLGDGEKVTGLSYKDRNKDDLHQVELEGIFVQIGLVPNTEWLGGDIALSRSAFVDRFARIVGVPPKRFAMAAG